MYGSRAAHTGRLLGLVLAIAFYGAITTAAVAAAWRHYELIALVLQCVLLGPALVIGLRGRRLSAITGWDAPEARARTGLLIAVFLAVALPLSWHIVRGVTNPDESSYRFQARILGAGRLVSPPPGGAPLRPPDAPKPLKFNHHVLWAHGWFSKFPIGWPLVLAIPEKLGGSWLVNPLLASGILLCAALIARVAYGRTTEWAAVGILVLSPYFLAQCVVLMSHALAGFLVAAATLLCTDGLRCGKMSRFVAMYGAILCALHVRPLTALIAAAVLSLSAFLYLGERVKVVRLAAIAAVAAAAAAGSLLLYNRALTGSALLSPYALYRGVAIPAEISATFPQVLVNLNSIWRASAQSTLFYAFPLVFVLAGLGFWKNRRNGHTAWILAAMFPALAIGHLLQFERSGSVIPERYWFEGYFAVAILAAEGISLVALALRSSRRALTAAACALVAIQGAMTAAAAGTLLDRSSPPAKVRAVAETLRQCSCVVFLKESPPYFYGQHLNLNGPDWKTAGAFYAVDPGPGERSAWSRRLGRDRWVVITYDPGTRTGHLVGRYSLGE